MQARVKVIKRFLWAMTMVCALAGSLAAQNTSVAGKITIGASGCGGGNCVYYQLPPNTPWVVLTVSGAWSGSVTINSISAPDARFDNLNAKTWLPMLTVTSNGTWSVATAGATFLAVQSSTLVSGSAQVTMSASQNGAPLLNPIFPGQLTTTNFLINGTFNLGGTVLTANSLSTLTAALATLGPASGTIRINGPIALTANLAIPFNVLLEPLVSSAFTLGTYNLTIQGPFANTIPGVFVQNNTGRVYFAQAGSIAEAYPDWWTTTSPDGYSAVNAALQAITGAAGTTNGTILLGCVPNETYQTDPVIISYDAATSPNGVADVPAGIDCHNATWQIPSSYAGAGTAVLSMYRITLGNGMFVTSGLNLDANYLVDNGLFASGNPGNIDHLTTIHGLLDGFIDIGATGGYGIYYTTWKDLASRHNRRHGFYFDGENLGGLYMNNVKIEHPVSQNNCGNGYELSTAQVTMSAPDAEDNDGVGADVRGNWTGTKLDHTWFEANHEGSATGVTCPTPSTYSGTIPSSGPYTVQIPAANFTTNILAVEANSTYLTLNAAASSTATTYTYTPEGLFTFNSAQAGDTLTITFATRASHMDLGLSASGEATDQGTATTAQGINGLHADGRSGYTLPWTTWTATTEYAVKQYVIPPANTSCAATDRYCFQQWRALTAYSTNDVVLPNINFVGDARWYQATAGCSSGSTEPAWPTQEGQTVTDTGGCVWTAHAIAYEVSPLHNGISGSSLSTWLAAPEVHAGTVMDGQHRAMDGDEHGYPYGLGGELG